MGRPIIGITGELEAARWGNWIREAVVSAVSYTRAVERAGGTPVVLPPVPAHSVPGLIAILDGVVLTGGRDLDPSLYDEEPHEQTEPPDYRRDRFELAVIRAAIDADLPFLAIGRGMHVLNVARGGNLTQHLPERLGNESHKPDPVKLTAHEVQLSAASRIGRALNTGDVTVPGGHHQAINRIGSGLLTVAWTQDQVVEAVELQGHAFGVGVQWHPEEGDDLRLFEALVAAGTPAAEAVAAAPPAASAPAAGTPAAGTPAAGTPSVASPSAAASAQPAAAATDGQPTAAAQPIAAEAEADSRDSEPPVPAASGGNGKKRRSAARR
jgi:gamma-glutamyl-gamma-aminobutyrate hydrolase PuuD